jgi:hypothetical protein
MSRSLHESEPLSRLPLPRLLLPAFAAFLGVWAVALSLGLSPTVLAVAGQIMSGSSGGPVWP